MGKASSLFLLLLLGLLLGGCAGVYYNTMEKLGIPKREILVDRVEEARGAQQAAKEQFASALHEFLAVTKVPASELQATYDRVKAEFDDCEKRAKEVRDRIDAIQSVADALFVEWSDELGQYNNPTLRDQSARQLETTKRRYAELRRVMDQAASRMDPVLTTFRDQVLFLKHNLNARALVPVATPTRALHAVTEPLIPDMNVSIREAEVFIRILQAEAK